MTDTKQNISLLLQNELHARRARNPAFSLRRFAQLAGISPASMSQVISGKRSLSKKMAEKVSAALGIASMECDSTNKLSDQDKKFVQRTHDHFEIRANWYYDAILSLAATHGASADSEAIAVRLGITKPQVSVAMERLQRLGLVAAKNGKLVATEPRSHRDQDVPNMATVAYQRQLLEKAADTLQSDKMLFDEIGSTVFPIDPKRLPTAKKIIADFHRQIAECFEVGTKRSVYCLGIQLFSLETNNDL